MNDPAKNLSQPREHTSKLANLLRLLGPASLVTVSAVSWSAVVTITQVGGMSGFRLIWLIVISCLLRGFIQFELARYALIHGRTSLAAFAEVPGPAIAGRGNWLVWCWGLMWLASICQLGGLIGGAGSGLAVAVPVTEIGRDYNGLALLKIAQEGQASRSRLQPVTSSPASVSDSDSAALAAKKAAGLEAAVEKLQTDYNRKYATEVDGQRRIRSPADALLWSSLLVAVGSLLLVLPPPRWLSGVAIVVVAVSLGLLMALFFGLQSQPQFAISAGEIASGLTLRFPIAATGEPAFEIAWAACCLVGVGSLELVLFPYWCQRHEPEPSVNATNEQADRSSRWKAWLHFNTWTSISFTTLATLAFYLLGAAILPRWGLVPAANDLIRTLSAVLIPTLSSGLAHAWLALAILVLLSSLLVITAGQSHAFADWLRVTGIIGEDTASVNRWQRRLCGVVPVLAILMLLTYPNPARLIGVGLFAQALMLPLLAIAALYFRYHQTGTKRTPSSPANDASNSWWDACLWLSAIAMLVIAGWTLYAGLAS
ncbi:hypothetical protein SH139x_005567 [Planctomycetaceae bacterium SH139]